MTTATTVTAHRTATLAERYSTIWPVAAWRQASGLTARLYARITAGRARWLRITTGAVLGILITAILAVGWAWLAVALVLWPLAWLMMLPVRIAVHRGAPNPELIYVLCWVSLPLLFLPVWWVALVMAFRAPQ